MALNGLLIGLLAAALLWGGPKHRSGPPGGPAGPAGGGEGMARAVIGAAPPENRAELQQIMRQSWQDTRAEREIVRKARRAVAESVTAADFDSAEILAEFKKWRNADLKIKRTVQQALVEALEKLPPESRESLGREIRARESHRNDRREKFRERMRERREE